MDLCCEDYLQKDEKGTSFTLHLNIPATVTIVLDASRRADNSV
ncbi:MAG: hypothetical protein PWP65_2140 [Clostridia bacterium]|nr:hypothetical protein [Clostridia bacterium]